MAMDLPSQPGPSTPWTKATNNRSRTSQEDSIGNAKHIKEDSHWLHPTTTHNRYAALSDDESIDHLQKVATDSTPKPSPIFVSDAITIPPLLQLLDQIVKNHTKSKRLLEIKSESSPKHPTHTEPSLKPLPKKTRHSILTNLNMNAITG
jgi:hypothetical protein